MNPPFWSGISPTLCARSRGIDVERVVDNRGETLESVPVCVGKAGDSGVCGALRTRAGGFGGPFEPTGASRSSRSGSISLHQCACDIVGACSWRSCIRTSDCKSLRLDTSVLSCSGPSRPGLRSAVALFANSIDVKTLSDQGEPCSGSNPCNHLSGHRIVYVTDVSTFSTN